MTEKTTDGRPSSKVARLIEQYELDGLGAELEARWTGDGIERMSLRDLAQYFNQRLLKQRLRGSGQHSIDTDVETLYQRLIGEDVSAGVRTETRNRLEQNGIDVESLEQDFVTYQAIRSYLTEYRSAEYEGISDAEKIEKDINTIEQLRTRTLSVTEDRIEKLRSTDRIAVRDFDILFDLQILCQQCGRQYAVADFLKQGGCECQQE